MTLAAAIFGRLAKAAITLLLIVILNFFLIHAAPGDPGRDDHRGPRGQQEKEKEKEEEQPKTEPHNGCGGSC